MSQPKAVYLDTSILRTFKKEINTPEFQELQNICNKLGVSILVPQIVVDEWIQYYLTKRAPDLFEKIDTAINNLNMITLSKKNLEFKIEKTHILTELKTYLVEQIPKVGMEIINTPEIKLDTLIDRAIKYVKPFKDKDKGFKDTIILFTILEHAKIFPQGQHLFVTNDGDFDNADVLQTASEFEVRLLVFKSVEDVKNHLQKYLKKRYERFLLHRSMILADHLGTQKEKIINHIKEHSGFSDMFFYDDLLEKPDIPAILKAMSGEYKPELFKSKSFKKINDIDLVEIINAKAGFLPKLEEKDWVDVSFGARIKFFLTVEVSHSRLSPKVSVGQEMDLVTFKPEYLLPRRELKEEIVIKEITIHAKVLVDKKDMYSDLIIKNIITY